MGSEIAALAHARSQWQTQGGLPWAETAEVWTLRPGDDLRMRFSNRSARHRRQEDIYEPGAAAIILISILAPSSGSFA